MGDDGVGWGAQYDPAGFPNYPDAAGPAAEVEPREGCKNADRLGPYATQSAATRALELVAERNEAWDNDPVWNDEDEPDDEDESGPAS